MNKFLMNEKVNFDIINEEIEFKNVLLLKQFYLNMNI